MWSAIVAAVFYLRPWHPLPRTRRQRVQRLLVREADPTVALSAGAAALVTDACDGHLGGRRRGRAAHGALGAAGRRPVRARVPGSCMASRMFDSCRRGMRSRSSTSKQRRRGRICLGACRKRSPIINLYRFMVEFRVVQPGRWRRHAAGRSRPRPTPRRPISLALLRIYQARRAHVLGEMGRGGRPGDVLPARQSRRHGAPMFLMCYGLFDADVLIGAGRIDDRAPVC